MSEPALPTFSVAYGPIEICDILAGILNGFLASQMISYFRSPRRDPMILKASIALIWAATTASFGCSCWILYVVSMTQHQVPITGISIPVAFSIAIVLDIVVHCMTQGIYIYRMFKFSHQIWLLIPCCALVLFEFGLALTWAINVAPLKMGLLIVAQDLKFTWIIDTLFAAGALLDLIITTSICYQLKQNRISGLKRTKDLIDTIIRWTIQSGLLTCVVAIVVLITAPQSGRLIPRLIYGWGLVMNGRMRLKNNAKDHITLTDIHVVTDIVRGNGFTDGSSELSRQLTPASKLKSSNPVARTGTEGFGPKA
ncbi:hypothetical protein BD779DRAFT_1667085 [Infundibulicybe gibba]|nr:hypothetical protein BD779DRAFT_1667085 [Infundibulicybe gibba]